MTANEAVNWVINITADIGKAEHRDLWHYEQALTEIREMLESDVQTVRHGHWIIKDNPGTGWYRVTCSACGEDVTSVAPVIGFFPKATVIWDFCPECGARMDGDHHE